MGSIRKAPRTGRWEARYRDPTGIQRTRTFERRSEAGAFLATVETDMQRGDWVDPALTRLRLDEWAREWRGTIVHLEPNTLAWYDGMLRVHVLPAFGDTPVGGIDQAAVRRFVASIAASGKSSQTVKGAYQTLRNVMATAQGAGAIRVNPCDGVKLPRPVKREKLFLSAEQVIDLSAAIDAPYGVLVTFAAYSGLRAGEIGGLRVGRLDLLGAKVDVAEALKDTAGGLHFGPTKNHERPTVRLPRFLCDLLGAYLAGRPNGSSDLVFTSPQGAPLRHNAFYRRQFKPAVAAAGLPSELRFHDLRHTCTALLIAQGAHPRAIMERLGHSSITVTIDTYGHLFPALDEALSDGLERTYQAARANRNETSCGADVVQIGS